MTIIQLEYIIAVDTHRHFAKAARSCFVTQPTLSMQIQKLEQELGVVLFDRSRQPVLPTDIGKRIIEQARSIVYESKKIKEIIDDEKKEITGDLRLGIIPTLAPYLLPLFISSFIEKYPDVNIQVEELLTDQVIYRLKHDLLDIGLIVTPSKDYSILEQPVFYEDFLAYVSSKHPLAKKEIVSPEEVQEKDVWLLNEGHCFREQVLNICKTKGSSPKGHFVYESGSLEALRRIVDKQGGLTLLPELATLELEATAKNNLRKFGDPVPVREVSIITHRSFLKKKLVDALRKEIVDSLPLHLQQKMKGKIINWKS